MKITRTQINTLFDLCRKVIYLQAMGSTEQLVTAIGELKVMVNDLDPERDPTKVPDYNRYREAAQDRADELMAAVNADQAEFTISVRYLPRRDRELVRNYIHRTMRKRGYKTKINWDRGTRLTVLATKIDEEGHV